MTPVLTGSGVACELRPAELGLSGAAPNAAAFLILGWDRAEVPFQDGVLVPHLAGPGSMRAYRTDANGNASISHLWPSQVPSASRLAFQFLILDPASPSAIAASNAVEIRVP